VLIAGKNIRVRLRNADENGYFFKNKELHTKYTDITD
jgi:hypothetical protein